VGSLEEYLTYKIDGLAGTFLVTARYTMVWRELETYGYTDILSYTDTGRDDGNGTITNSEGNRVHKRTARDIERRS
jgi:hypothetical protein